MAEQKYPKRQEGVSHPSMRETSSDVEPCYSSDPNQWCPKHGPHPSD